MAKESGRSIGARINEFQPTKAMLVWALIAGGAITVAAGFSVGGWVTQSTAEQMRDDARVELASAVCVDNFLSTQDARAQLEQLQTIRSALQRRQFVEAGGWATMPGEQAAARRTADICARALVDVQIDTLVDQAQAEDATGQVEAIAQIEEDAATAGTERN